MICSAWFLVDNNKIKMNKVLKIMLDTFFISCSGLLIGVLCNVQFSKISIIKMLKMCIRDRYDMIHFHSIDAMYLCRKTLENYKGKVILTSHSPCAKYKEKLAWLNPVDYKLFKKWVEKIEMMDAYSFNRADYII